MKVIGLMGRKQTGKDSFAKIATEILGPKFVEVLALADPLKNFCHEYLNVPFQSCFGENEDKDKTIGTWGQFFNPVIMTQYDKNADDAVTGREILQVVGTDVFRHNLHRDIWVRLCLESIKDIKKASSAKLICITDVRFPNEFDRLKEAGAKIVKLYRQTDLTDSIIHPSETSMELIPETALDYVIEEEDNVNLDMLKKQVLMILNAEGLLDTEGVAI